MRKGRTKFKKYFKRKYPKTGQNEFLFYVVTAIPPLMRAHWQLSSSQNLMTLTSCICLHPAFSLTENSISGTTKVPEVSTPQNAKKESDQIEKI